MFQQHEERYHTHHNPIILALSSAASQFLSTCRTPVILLVLALTLVSLYFI